MSALICDSHFRNEDTGKHLTELNKIPRLKKKITSDVCKLERLRTSRSFQVHVWPGVYRNSTTRILAIETFNFSLLFLAQINLSLVLLLK